MKPLKMAALAVAAAAVLATFAAQAEPVTKLRTIVPLQHADGRAAMEKGEVDAWSGLDPMMGQAELGSKAKLLFRDPYLNTYGVLNVRDDFAEAHPDLIERVLR